MSSAIALSVVTVAVLAVLGLHMLMSRIGPAWLGAVIPCLFVIAVVVLVVRGLLEPGRPYLAVGAALVMLLWIWSSGRQARTKAKAGGASDPTRAGS